MTSPTIHRLSTALLAGALALGGVGCGKITEKATEKLVEKGIEAGTGGKVDIDSDGGKFEIRTEDGALSFDGDDGAFSMETEDGSFRSGSGMPDGWPGDIPLPPGFEAVAGHTADEGEGSFVGVAGAVDASPEQVMAFYADALSDWEETSTSTMGGGDDEMRTATYERGGRRFSISTYRDEDRSSVNMQHADGAD